MTPPTLEKKSRPFIPKDRWLLGPLKLGLPIALLLFTTTVVMGFDDLAFVTALLLIQGLGAWALLVFVVIPLEKRRLKRDSCPSG